MFNFIKNKFLFILMLSIITLALLIVGAVTLYKSEDLVFNNEGYVISTTTKSNTKYYFSANTKYKDNADKKVAFKDKKSNSVAVDPASFTHYSDGSIGYLKKGVLVNLGEINSPIISYYNVTRNNLIKRENNKYVVSSNDNNININSFIGRISDNKYIVAGSNISLNIPNNNEKITSNYFEILFIDNGIVKIYNENNNYQVTAQNSYIHIDNDTMINLGNGKIYYNGEAKMLLSQITINGDENIDLDVVTNNKDSNGNNKEEDENAQKENDQQAQNNSQETEEEEKNEDEENQNASNQAVENDSPQIDLINAKITATMIDASLQLNNSGVIKGELIAQLTNVLSSEKEDPITIPIANGTFRVKQNALLPDTEYTLTIIEKDSDNEKQYYQKTFKTKKIGITLEKQYSTSNSLAYEVKFDADSEIEKVKVSIYNNNGSNEGISPNEYIVSKNDIDKTFEFTGLYSNNSYSVIVDTAWIDSVEYKNIYTINRIDSTLKKTPNISDIEIKTNSEEVKFNIKLNKIDDPDNSITSYIYKIYEANSIGLNNKQPQPVYTITKNNNQSIDINLNEIDELKAGVDYRCKIVAQYNDNEMIREAESDYSGNFLVKSKPSISWEQETATMNKVEGTITLIDTNCTVPIHGRRCLNETSQFTLRYYKLGTDESKENDKQISFDPQTLKYKMSLNDLSSGTTYVVKVYGSYYDDSKVLHKDVQIGEPFYIKTNESENLKLKIIGDNKSGTNKDGSPNPQNIVTFDAMLNKPQDSNIDEEVSSITLNLYSGNYTNKDKLIGTYVMKDRNTIEDFFSSYTITNNIFENKQLGNLDSLSKMIKATNNSTNTLTGAYTVEVTKVLDSTGHNEITVEDNVYTFKLTPSYYLDSRIENNPNYQYISVTPIAKKDLTSEAYEKLSKTISNLEELNDDTIVGITIDNSLSDEFVNSAFTYEKVIVDYVVYNSVTKKEIKRISVDMQNKYEPKSVTIYLDPTELEDGKKYFTRGYDYKISYELKFTIENGETPTYTHEKLSKDLSIERQMPIIKQYISTSDQDSVTYRYSIKDIDNALYDKKLYYKIEESKDYLEVSDELEIDNEYHFIKVPINERNNYSIYINRKNTKNESNYTEISTNQFEKEYNYNNEVLFSLADDNDNTLKIKLENNEITQRAIAYKVTIKDKTNPQNADYVRFFLASRLKEITNATEEEQDLLPTKYISIDYANISKFMQDELEVSVNCYYDSGLIGFNQQFTNGMILENKVKGRYLNIYNSGSNTKTTNKEEQIINGIYMQKEPYKQDDNTMFLYNYLENTLNYNAQEGTTYYNSNNLASNIGINYNLTVTNNGIVFNDGKTDFAGYTPKVLKIANLQSDNNHYKFNSIVPKVSLDTTGSTINSIKLKVISSGIYGQFMKDSQPHNKYYLDIYSDKDLTQHLTQLTSDITISDTKIEAETVEYKDLKPNTTYYVTISAYLDGKLTKLYDMQTQNSYTTKTYEAKTLNADGILDKITLSVNPVSYNGASSNKSLKYNLKLKNTENYKIRFELFDNNSQPVNFNGKQATGCDNNQNGTSNSAYVNGCYIQIPKEEITNINDKTIDYTFTGDDFVFGGGYYKLIVYAIPYSKDTYSEDDKLILYQNDSLSTTGDKIVSGEPDYNITIPTLEEPTFDLNNTLTSGYRTVDGAGEYYIEFTPTVTDDSKVIKYGKYTVTLKDDKNAVIETKSDISVDSLNQKIVFTKLNSNTQYYIEISYETYRNNNGLSESQKSYASPYTDFIYTPIDSGITLGTITAQQSGNNKVILAYNGAFNMIDNITKVSYTISQKGGSSKISGEYSTASGKSIFELAADKTPKLTIDFSENSSGFTLKSNNTYIISTQYWFMSEGREVQLEDKNTHNTTFTAILNL